MTLFTVLLTPIMIVTGLVLIFRFINQKYNPPIFGVYQQRNKFFWLKFAFMYVYLRAKQLYHYLRGLAVVELGYSYDGTVHIHEDDVQLEQKFDLGDYEKSVDAVYFNGYTKDGIGLIAAVARRQELFCDAFMYLKLNGEDLLLSPDLPNTRLKQSPSEENEYRAGGIHLSSVIPMRTWKVHYDGEMKFRSNPEKRVIVHVNLTWSAGWPAFNHNIDISPLTMAKDLARESWSADYFKRLQKAHQAHYEQMGFLHGNILVDGKEHQINMPCVRDHSFGKHREWRNFHRYVLNFIYLENGDCMAIGVVSQPQAVSHLTIGYLCRKWDQAVLPVKACDFQLWQHGENQTMPKDFAFTFKAGGDRYDVHVLVHEEDSFYIGKDRESKIYERWVSVVVNNVEGWGCLEWQYNNVAAAS